MCNPTTTTRLSTTAKLSVKPSAVKTSPPSRAEKDAAPSVAGSFIADACQAASFLAALVAAAARGMFHTVTLQEKLSLQGSGWGYWLDVISGDGILLYYVAMLFGMMFQKKVDRRLIRTLLPGLVFSFLANYFHAMLDERGEYPHWSFAQAFLALGSFLLYSMTDIFGRVSGGQDSRLIRSAKAHFACLPLVPLGLFLMFPPDEASDALNLFLYNGWVFIYVAYAIDAPLKLAKTHTDIEEFGLCRYALPILSLVCFLEDYVVRVLRMDPHIFTHVLTMAFACTANNGIEKAYRLKKKD